VGRIVGALGIRLVDMGAAAAVAVAVELNASAGGGSGAHPLHAWTYLLYGTMAIPVLFRHKWPLRVLIACSVLLLLLYLFYRRNISPAPPLALPVYDAALAGYLIPAIVIPAWYMIIGLFVVEESTHEKLTTLSIDFLLPAAVLALAIMLGDSLRSRRALAAQTAEKLRLAGEERDAEAARAVAEERVRIARELHDTVAHSMATITVQAGSALHLLGDGQDESTARATGIRAALVAIRETSKGALTDMRATLGQLRGGGDAVDGAETRTGGLDRLAALSDAVRAAGAPVSVTVEGSQEPLPPAVDHAAYRILQESLTNVLRHAGPAASASVRLSYAPGALTIQVTDDGPAGQGGSAPGTGHGLTGMGERAAAVGGQLSAGQRQDGGFEVVARLPFAAAGASR
jgi:signal transduction histidine kinase